MKQRAHGMMFDAGRGWRRPFPSVRGVWAGLVCGVVFALSPGLRAMTPQPTAGPVSLRLLMVRSLDDWTSRTQAGVPQWTSPEWRPGFAWNEAVPSWNVVAGSAWTIELRAVGTNQTGTWFPLGQWCSDTNRAPRTSWTGGSLAGGKVLTDTLRLEQAAEGIQVRLTAGPGTTAADFRQFAVSLADTRVAAVELEPFRPAWGRVLAVPARSQADFPEGVTAWCSPTSVTMLLAWWQERRGRPLTPPDVRETAAAVFDPGWPGTGNWAFNLAYAGQVPGLRSAVVRLADIPDLERWIDAGLPVAVSVSYALLQERPRSESGDGHLVVVRGFTADGDVAINDPGVRISRVQRQIPRAAFRAAWRHSRNTAYLIWPDDQALPVGGEGRWGGVR